MTRREEIAKQAEITVFPWDEPQEQNKFQDGFIEGAKWADKTMIEKATQWLFENVYDYLNPEDQERVESFRKYLEE
jgi:hypothetical protein